MANPAVPVAGTSSEATRSTTASGGACSGSASTKRARAAGSPSTSIRTPRSSFRTNPASPSRRASRYTYGRKPTPWTTPSTRTRRRAVRAGVETVVTSVRLLEQFPQNVVRARLRLLDARNVLRPRHDHVIGERLGRHPPAVVADHRDGRQPSPARLGERCDHVVRVAARGQRQQRVAG